MVYKLILASTSPRRKALLEQVHIPFEVVNTNVNESIITTNNPKDKVIQLAKLKGKSVALQRNKVILSADTVVSYQGRIFEKPVNREAAYEMITTLNGKTHDVFTGVMIRSNERKVIFAEQTQVKFMHLTEEEINLYIDSKEPYDKAGGYGIQGKGATLVKQIIGDYYNVVGLPLARTVRELRNFSIYPE